MTPPASSQMPWCWSGPVRQLLILLAVALAAALLVVARTSNRPPGAPVPGLVVDPHDAPVAVLMALPQLGPARAAAIVAARQAQPFQSLDDLEARVRGIGPATAAAIASYLRFPDERGPMAATPPTRDPP